MKYKILICILSIILPSLTLAEEVKDTFIALESLKMFYDVTGDTDSEINTQLTKQYKGKDFCYLLDFIQKKAASNTIKIYITNNKIVHVFAYSGKYANYNEDIIFEIHECLIDNVYISSDMVFKANNSAEETNSKDDEKAEDTQRKPTAPKTPIPTETPPNPASE